MSTRRADLSRAMYLNTKEVFKKTLKKNRKEEWKECVTLKESDKMEENYDSVGNLKPAEEKLEGQPITYGKIEEAYVTTIKNRTWSNGFMVSMEAKEDEKWDVVDVAKTEELARTILQLRERNVAAVWNSVTTRVGADGVALAAANHPLKNSTAVNNNLISGAFNLANYQDGVNRFNEWKNHAGDLFDTMATHILAHSNRQTEIYAMLQSANVPFEQSNTKNTIEKLTPIFNRYINKLMVHLIDKSIDSVVMQRRKGIITEYDYDKRSTFNWFFNVHERYEVGAINPGFGFLTITGQ